MLRNPGAMVISLRNITKGDGKKLKLDFIDLIWNSSTIKRVSSESKMGSFEISHSHIFIPDLLLALQLPLLPLAISIVCNSWGCSGACHQALHTPESLCSPFADVQVYLNSHNSHAPRVVHEHFYNLTCSDCTWEAGHLREPRGEFFCKVNNPFVMQRIIP